MSKPSKFRRGREQPCLISLHQQPRQGGALTGVPLVKNSPRAPLGPSEVLIEGMPFSGIAIDRQKSAPASNEICSGQLIKPLNGVRFLG